MNIAVIGGGPAGLYFSLLVKRARPNWTVRLYERNRRDETFGFGVVFSEPTLAALATSDPATHTALLAGSQRWSDIAVTLGGKTVRCSGQGFAAIGRRALLAMLRTEAERAGVDLRYETTVDPTSLPSADLVVAADGSRSAIRRRFAEHFEPSVTVGSTKFIWFGTTKRFDALTFAFESDRNGAFAVHAYPFDERTSTFIVETDEETWRRAGLDREGDEAAEQRSLAYCTAVFAPLLGDHHLIANHSAWGSFRTLRTERWHRENVVLLGDAAHTAHFSVGSGTKMALEDAAALARAVTGDRDLGRAAAVFEAERRPDVGRVQGSAGPSLFWWEHFRYFTDLAPFAFAFHFMTRNFKVSRESLLRRDPGFVAAVERERAETAVPLVLAGQRLDDALVGSAGSAPSSTASILAFDEAPPASAADTRRLLVAVNAQAKDHDARVAAAVRAGARAVLARNVSEGNLCRAVTALRGLVPPDVLVGVVVEPDTSAVNDLLRDLRECAPALDVVAVLAAHPASVTSRTRAMEIGSVTTNALRDTLTIVEVADRGAAETTLLARRGHLCYVRG